MKLIIIPLTIMFILSMLSMTGLGTPGTLGNGDIGRVITRTVTNSTYYVSAGTIYYDDTGHPVCYANLTAIGEPGKIVCGDTAETAMWDNSTGWIHTSIHNLYYDTGGFDVVLYRDAIAPTWGGDTPAYTRAELGVDPNSSLGLIAIVIAVMALSLLVGIKFAASGESDVSIGMVLKCTAYLSVWAIFSVLAFGLITQIATFGPILYLALTLMYTLGLINSVGSPSNE